MNLPPERHSPSRILASNTAERIATIIEAAERAAAAVIDDAEAQARRYLEEAQEETDRIVSERLASLSQLTDSLVDQAEAIRRQSGRLLSSLEGVAPRIGPAAPQQDLGLEPGPALEPEPQQAPISEPRISHLSAVSPPPAPPQEPPAPSPPPPRETPTEPPPPFEPAAAFEEPAPAFTPTEPEARPLVDRPPPPAAAGNAAGARLLATQMAVSGSSRAEIEARLRSGFDIADPAPILDAIMGPEA